MYVIHIFASCITTVIYMSQKGRIQAGGVSAVPAVFLVWSTFPQRQFSKRYYCSSYSFQANFLNILNVRGFQESF